MRLFCQAAKKLACQSNPSHDQPVKYTHLQRLMQKILNIPIWFLALFSGAKSFRANPVIGNPILNTLGLHVIRLLLAHGIMRLRMLVLGWKVAAEDRKHYQQQGYVLRENFLPPDFFAQLEQEIRSYRGEIRECAQGDTLNHRTLLDPDALEALPVTRRLMALPELRRLLRYTAGHLRMPLCHIEQLHNGAREDHNTDPQKDLHTDTFHPTMKFWLFLDDVDEQNGPFTYVPGSNRLTLRRLSHEYQLSRIAAKHNDTYTARGSFRFNAADRKKLGLAEPKALKVKKNTLVIANTFGIHGRGRAESESTRLAIWGMSRTNPFLPFPGLGFEFANRIQYQILQWTRQRDDERATKRGIKSAWHKLD